MPPRTRSKPYGPDSPNAAQGLPDPAPRRRRTTRSVSAQPQEEQPAQPLREPKTRKTRGKASSRGRKKVTRPTASASADGLQEEQLEASALSSDVNSQPQIETNRADDGTDDARLATPSVEVPATVLQSIETSEPETTAPTSTGLFSLQRKSDSRSRPQSGSAQLPSPSQSHVLRPQNASPIRRTRTPRSRRSSTHRTEGSESFSRTLFRLPELLSSHNEAEADSGQAVETNSAEQQEFVDTSATVVARTESPAPAPATPKRERAASPVAPLTAPPAAVNGSPGWSRWIFNGVSRRWTVLRSRLNPEENDDEAHSVAASNSPTSFPPISQAAADRNEIAEDPEATADVKNIQAAVSASFPAPTVSIASRAVEKISNILSPRRIQARTSSTISASPRRRRRATSFVDARTLLNPDAPTSGQGYESQHSFVKRRQAARLAIEREQREARNRELADAKIAEAAVREATRRKALAAEFTTSLRPAIPHRRSTERPGQSEQGNPTSDITGQTATGSVPKANESNPRKRNRGFGLDEDDLAVHEEDFTPEEWNVLKVQVEKAEEEAAKAAQELAPPTKKRRVDENPQQQKRTRQSDRHNTSGTSRQTQPPARQPGFIPNKRGTFAPPDLPTIDSSRLMSDPDSPSNTKDPQTTPQTPSDDEINMPVSENDIETENVNDEQGSSPLTRARNKAEQFKPKTPSRLRESARFPTSNQSTPAGLDMSSPSFSDAFQNSNPVQSRPLPVDDSPFLVHADKIPPLAGPTTSDSSLPRLQSEAVFPAQAETEGSTAPLAAEVAWLSETLPDGQFDRLKWPSSREVIEHFRIDSNSLKIVNEESQPKGTDFAQYLQDLFENCGADPTGVPMSL